MYSLDNNSAKVPAGNLEAYTLQGRKKKMQLLASEQRVFAEGRTWIGNKAGRIRSWDGQGLSVGKLLEGSAELIILFTKPPAISRVRSFAVKQCQNVRK
jgi:hypothetical protein